MNDNMQYSQMNPIIEEAYRTLRTNIQFCGINKKIKTIAITSSTPGEGKTTTSINLAASMAQTGMKVLLVDADMRKPMVSRYLGRGSHLGLTNMISGIANLEDIVRTNGTHSFYYISCGPKPPNPAELIGSAAFKDFVRNARALYDMVIFDTPPLGSVIDSALISSMTDGTLLVIRSNSIDFKIARRVKEQLEKASAHLLGVVLNKMDKGDYRNNYGYYYNYYDNKAKEKKGLLDKLGIVKKSEKVFT